MRFDLQHLAKKLSMVAPVTNLSTKEVEPGGSQGQPSHTGKFKVSVRSCLKKHKGRGWLESWLREFKHCTSDAWNFSSRRSSTLSWLLQMLRSHTQTHAKTEKDKGGL